MGCHAHVGILWSHGVSSVVFPLSIVKVCCLLHNRSCSASTSGLRACGQIVIPTASPITVPRKPGFGSHLNLKLLKLALVWVVPWSSLCGVSNPQCPLFDSCLLVNHWWVWKAWVIKHLALCQNSSAAAFPAIRFPFRYSVLLKLIRFHFRSAYINPFALFVTSPFIPVLIAFLVFRSLL